MPGTTFSRKKLIEVMLPLDAIGAASERERSVRRGHPSLLHPWWARRPLAACRAALFALLVDDPSSHPDRFPTEQAQAEERQRLMRLMEELIRWEGTNDERVLAAAREEIRKSYGGQPPPVLDPYAGGGSIPLEAQRLGLETYASDSSPLAVLINKALIELPASLGENGAKGFAEALQRYGGWMADQAAQRLAPLYPQVKLPAEQGAGEATVAAWLWVRTVPCPNSSCGALVPLAPSFVLADLGDDEVWAEPIIDSPARRVRFEVRTGEGPAPEGTWSRRGGHCLVCGGAFTQEWVRECGQAGMLGAQMMAIVAELGGKRHYLSPTPEHEEKALQSIPEDAPEQQLISGIRSHAPLQAYGLTRYRDLFTPRQLTALGVLSNLVVEARTLAAEETGRTSDFAGGLAIYLAFTFDKLLPAHCTLAVWDNTRQRVRPALSGQTLRMTWTFAEANPLHENTGLERAVEAVGEVLNGLPSPALAGHARLEDAARASSWAPSALILTDPPYFDNVDYEHLTGFFHVWLKRMLGELPPESLSSTGSLESFRQLLEQARSRPGGYPVALFWATRDWDTEPDEVQESPAAAPVSTSGLAELVSQSMATGFELCTVWPLRMEVTRAAFIPRQRSSTLLVSMRPRPAEVPVVGRQEFLATLEHELATRWQQLESASQDRAIQEEAAQYLGAVILSRYAAVLEPDGAPMTVQAALQLSRQLAREWLLAPETERRPEALPQQSGPAARLTRVRVEGYKSLAHCEVALVPLTFLVGPNGAGKSNFLDALRFVAESLRSGSLPQRESTTALLYRNGREAGSFSVQLELELAGGRHASYSLRVGGQEGPYRVLEEFCRVEQPPADEAVAEFRVIGGRVTTSLSIEPPLAHAGRPYLPMLSTLPAFRPVYEALSTMMIYDPQPAQLRQPGPRSSLWHLASDGSNLPGVLARLPTELQRRIETFLAAIVPGVQGVERCELGPVETLQFTQQLSEHAEPQRFYAASMSDGTLRALALLVALFQARQEQGPRVSLVAIEEPEIAIHPAAVAVLRDALREASRYTQVLVTSHSPDLLDDKEIEAEQLLSVAFEEGKTRMGSVDEVGRSALKDRLYTAGELLRVDRLRLQRPDEPR